jgi:hypothetical protein
MSHDVASSPRAAVQTKTPGMTRSKPEDPGNRTELPRDTRRRPTLGTAPQAGIVCDLEERIQERRISSE